MTSTTKNSQAFIPGAAIRGDTLVLTLPDAVNPVVWQFDLSSVKASALEVNAVGDAFALRLKTPRGEVHDIAAYTARDQAVHVLSLVHHALAANTNAPIATSSVAAGPVSRRSNWPLAVSAIVIFVSLYVLLSALMSVNAPRGDQTVSATTTSNAPVPTGEAVSADDILQGRGP